MSLASALKRSWSLVLLSAVICASAGLIAGLVRDPEYKAEAQLYVGSFDVRSLAVPGFVTASLQIADAYSRLANSDAVVVPVSRRLRLTRDEVRQRLTTSNIPGSPVVRIEGVGSSRRAAVDLVRAASAATASRVSRFTSRNADAERNFKRFQAAAVRAQQAEARALQLRSRRANGENVPTRTITAAQARAETARLRATTFANLYGEARANTSGAANVHVIDAGGTATNDRNEVLQRLVLLGALAGLVLGAALATLQWRRLLYEE
jgi:uncharacterized protein involved in exopolysaccharide biosynthesis